MVGGEVLLLVAAVVVSSSGPVSQSVQSIRRAGLTVSGWITVLLRWGCAARGKASRLSGTKS